MFRDAFGQKQPEGAQPLGGWDSQETKLRGHATGHFLSALAQAYASTGYDASLRANFAGKMEYMVNTLYELSQKSGQITGTGAELMDYYERGLYNHILASVAEYTPANTYHVPLLPGSLKQFGNPEMDGFPCCNGTALESNTKLQNSIYFKSADNRSLYVNLYVPSTLEWKDRNLTITQTTAYPKEDRTRFTGSPGVRATYRMAQDKSGYKGCKQIDIR